MKVEIRFIRFQTQYGRSVAVGTLFEHGKDEPLAATSLGALMTEIHENDHVLMNAQEVLDWLVRVNGFAS